MIKKHIPVLVVGLLIVLVVLPEGLFTGSISLYQAGNRWI